MSRKTPDSDIQSGKLQSVLTEKGKRGIGLVLAGGGTKGAYEIGAWKALKESGLFDQFTGFSGSSIGAFNTALFVNGDLNLAEKIWHSMKLTDFCNLNEDLIREKFKMAEGCSPKEAFGQNVRIKYASKQAVKKAADSLTKTLDNNIHRRITRLSDKLNGSETIVDVSDSNSQELEYNRHTKRNFMVWCMRNLFGSGFAKPDRLREILDENLPHGYVARSGADIFSTVCEWDPDHEISGTAEYINWKGKSREELLNLIMASASLPVLYPQINTMGRTFVDGGYADNEPIQPLYDAGYRQIMIIYLDKYKGKKLKKIIREQEDAFPGCEFLRLIPNKKFDDGFAKSCIISEKLTASRMESGYEDCKKLLLHEL